MEPLDTAGDAALPAGVAATLNIALQGCAVALMSPFASETLGAYLHDLTGKWTSRTTSGHHCYIVAERESISLP